MTQKVYVLGGAQTDFQRNWSKEGKSLVALMKEALEDSLRETQIDLSEIRTLARKNRIAIVIGNFNAQQFNQQGHLGAMLTLIDTAFYGIPGIRCEAACASGAAAIDVAQAKIVAGEIDLAIVLGVEQMKSVASVAGGTYLGTAAYFEKEAKNISFPFPKLFGKLADAMIEHYQIPEKKLLTSLSCISAKNYKNAKNNPNAQTRQWFMSKTHAQNRNTKFNPNIGGKLSNADCSQITDGAACVLLASRDFCRDYIKKRKFHFKKLPHIAGIGITVAPFEFEAKIQDLKKKQHILPWTAAAVSRAYMSAGLRLANIDVIETHDCFTSSEYACISAFGITRSGREFEAVENGTIEISGKYPINPSGGLIGVGHPVGATGVRMALDIWKQLTENAGSYQLNKRVKNGLMLNIGGSATTNFAIIMSL